MSTRPWRFAPPLAFLPRIRCALVMICPHAVVSQLADYRQAYERHQLTSRVIEPPGVQIYRTKVRLRRLSYPPVLWPLDRCFPEPCVLRPQAPPLHPDCLTAGLVQPSELSIFEVDGSKAKVCLQIMSGLTRCAHFPSRPSLYPPACPLAASRPLHPPTRVLARLPVCPPSPNFDPKPKP